ncbi:hypothetical protein BKA82DRAFT_1002669 [Pisolithus tinctorius]|uniref:F-box domain-containing protein n=1 Tax=Pisolithus tinctorius Marx 270 TaxID=870435 RepID=A0A0C3P3R7_PISTI|nr:hypothetical protein BKA82DRAFT_1002669 [Pisolithus tinctorius]KIO01919.1 hypothetical protein M404DRAFT_1002669 [Pisolithus tinctorius Marx 270]
MDELDEARAKLGQLRGTERTLFKQLVEIRAAIKIQKNKIDELVKKRPPPINRLPTELLSRIIFLSLPDYDGQRRPMESGIARRRSDLSTVSPLWRSVVLGTPEIWRDIVLYAGHITIESLKTHLTRSGNAPLNIFITGSNYDHYEQAQSWLDVVVSSADRWRCLYVHHLSNRMLAEVLDALEGLKFPSLEDVTIDNMNWVTNYPQFLLPNQAPALRNLKLDDLFPAPELAASTTLTTLDVSFRFGGFGAMNLTFIPTQSLTTLSLGGDTSNWTLPPDSIHLPLLEVLKLTIGNPRLIMRAIVAPKLGCLDYSNCGGLGDNRVDFDTGSKFSHVQRVIFNFCRSDMEGYRALCQEFCGARDVTLRRVCMDLFFTPECQVDDSGSVPADHWTSLESLTIYDLYFDDGTETFDPLMRWLANRLEFGGPRVSVRLSGLSTSEPTAADGTDLRDLYHKLQTCSNPIVDKVVLCCSVHCSTSSG